MWLTSKTSSAFAPLGVTIVVSRPTNKRGVANNPTKGIVVALYESSKNTNNAESQQQQQEGEENLNDVDARVLQSLLADQKLDLDTEEDIRKLLERGTVKRVVQAPADQSKAVKADSEFSSQVLQKLSETKLFQKLRRNAFDFFESASIAILNKIERDVKVVAALGVFAWDRAVRDVGRALPAASSAGSSSTSSSTQQPPGKKTMPFLITANSTRPQDELRLVRESVAAIVKQGSDPGRAIRTAAPTGRANAKARQTKAFEAKRQQRSAATNPTKLLPKVGGAVLDTVYELKRELQVETSQPGYRTAPARAAIQAATKGLIDQARTAVALRSAERERVKQQQLPLPIDYQFGVGKAPPPPTKRAEDTVGEAEEAAILEQTQQQQQQKRAVRSDEAYTYSYQDLQDYTTVPPPPPPPPQDQQKAQKFQSDLWKKATIVTVNDDDNIDVAIPTDVEFVRSSTDVQFPTYEVDFANSRAAVEIVSDDDDEFGDYSTAFAEAKPVGDSELEEDDGDQPPNPLTQLALRSFDIVFFLLEKVFLVAVPETFATLSRVASRIENIQRKGRGKEGWAPLQNVAPSKGRY
jgi:hypothetical protein